MRKVIDNDDRPVMSVNDVRISSNMYAYQSEAGGLFVLSRLGQKYVNNKYGEFHYGFVCLSTTGTVPSHVGDTFKDSIRTALKKGRGVMEFDNLTELLKWKLNIE